MPSSPIGTTGGLHTRRERGLADEAIAPHGVEQLDLGDHTIAMFDEVHEQIEDLWLDVHDRSMSSQLEERDVELAIVKAEQRNRR